MCLRINFSSFRKSAVKLCIKNLFERIEMKSFIISTCCFHMDCRFNSFFAMSRSGFVVDFFEDCVKSFADREFSFVDACSAAKGE